MATSNHERIGRGLQVMAKGLEPRVIAALEAVYKDKWKTIVDEQAIGGTGYPVTDNTSDPQFILNTIWFHWNQVFGKSLGKSERSLVAELRDVRNKWAHSSGDKAFSLDDVYRSLDSIERLLTGVGAADEAAEAATMRHEVGQLRYAADSRKSDRQAAAAQAAIPSAAGLPSWRAVITPHPDVAAGRFIQAEFAADLGQVSRGQGSIEYLDPKAFFERTYLTQGLADLLHGALQRLTGTGGEPVIELQTNFGGGKTHSMLALYHLVASRTPAELSGIDGVLERAGVETLPQVRRVVLAGTALSPGLTTRHDGVEVRTMWGELAWQLGGSEAYAELADADGHGVSPGSAVMLKMLDRWGPALILIDEWVTFIRQLWGVDGLPAGSFDANLSFAQSLTEAVKGSKNSLLVASLPASDNEIGGEGGVAALARLRNTIGRVQSPWRPASTEEGFEIIRRRLFQPIVPENVEQRDGIVQSFADQYQRHTGEFPPDTKEAAYQRRLEREFPIHPELFDRLFADWSSLERFQRTRGVLRLMARVIRELWERQDGSPMIMPGTIPLDQAEVVSELKQYLDDSWIPVIESEVDGPQSVPFTLDSTNQTIGRYAAGRRVARTIFMGSAPKASAAHRGIDDQRIRLGAVQPGENPATFGDALRRLTDRSAFLYDAQGRYWFSTTPSVNQLARDRAEQVRPEDIYEEIRKHLKGQQFYRGDFARVHAAPRTGADVPDEDEVALVILGPEAPYSSKSEVSKAREAAEALLNDRGAGPRRNRNMLLFLAADEARLEELAVSVRQAMAWESIKRDRDTKALTFDTYEASQIDDRVTNAQNTVKARLPEAYQWLLYPVQEGTSPVEWQALRLTGGGELAQRASKKAVSESLLLPNLGGVALRLELNRYPAMWEGGDVPIKKLWDQFCQYLYLPRLRDSRALVEAVEHGISSLLWRSETFAYAQAKEGEEYLGLVAGQSASVLMDDRSVIVHPDTAGPLIDAQAYPEPQPPSGGPHAPQPPYEPTPEAHRRFHGSVRLDATRPSMEFARIADEVIKHLAGVEGTSVEISVDIAASHAQGFSDEVRRTVTENARTLRFDAAEFEKE